MKRRTQLGIVLGSAAVVSTLLFGIRPVVRHFAPAAYESCNAKLKHIYVAKQTWLLDHEGDTNSVQTERDFVGPGKYFSRKPICPQGGTYTYGKPEEFPQCSIPMHSLEFGKVCAIDAQSNRIDNASVTLRIPKRVPRISVTDATGETWLTRFPASEAEAWDGANITVSKTGYRNVALALPTRWPLVVRLERE